MTTGLDIATRRLDDGRTEFAFRGRINERFDPRSIIDAAPRGEVVLNLAGVRHVSSVGIREFERLIERLERVTLVEISPAIATHIVLLPTLAARVHVASAQLPFSCAKCGNERVATVPFAKGAARLGPTCSCGSRMDLDGLPEQLLPSE